jgi:predicted nucleic acid-binding Zn ribbon protein
LIVSRLPPGKALVFDAKVPSDEPREYRLNLNDKRDRATLLALLILYGKDLVVVSEGGGWVRVKHHS